MIIQITAGELARSLKLATKVIQKKAAMPMLERVVIKCNGDCSFQMIAGNSDAGLTTPIAFSVIEGEQIPVFAFHPSEILSVVQTMSADTVLNVNIEEKGDGGTLRFEHINGEFSIPYVDADEYPMPAKLTEETCAIHLSKDVLLPAISQACKFTKISDVRPQLGSVLIDVKQDELAIVGTDTKVFYRKIYGNGTHGNGAPFLDKGTSAELVLFSPNLLPLLSIFAESETVSISTNGKITLFTDGDNEYIMRNVEYKYPNYKSIIPSISAAYQMDVEKDVLMAIARRLRVFTTGDSELLALKVSNGQVEMLAEDVDMALSANESVPVQAVGVPDMTVGFNSTNFLLCLQAMEAETVRLYVTSPERVVVVGAASEDTSLITMFAPMLL